MNNKTIIFLALAVLLAGYFFMTRSSQTNQTNDTASAGASAYAANAVTKANKNKLDAKRPTPLKTAQEKNNDATKDAEDCPSAIASEAESAAGSEPSSAKDTSEKNESDKHSEAYVSALADTHWNKKDNK